MTLLTRKLLPAVLVEVVI